MKALFLTVILLIAAACSNNSDHHDPAVSNDSDFGTRGGGDVCELDYHQHLKDAYDWLTHSGLERMNDSERAKLSVVTPKTLDAIVVTCDGNPIQNANEPKTAWTEVNNGKVKTHVDLNRWIVVSLAGRTSLAIHEILVMSGIEHTDDYHVTSFYDGSTSVPDIKSLDCRRMISQGHVMTFHLDANPNAHGFVAQLTFDSAPEAGRPAQSQSVVISKQVFCEFAGADETLFSCYESPELNETQKRIALELVRTTEGQEMRIYWSFLAAPSISLREMTSLVTSMVPTTTMTWIDDLFSIPFGPSPSEAVATQDDPRAMRCQATEN